MVGGTYGPANRERRETKNNHDQPLSAVQGGRFSPAWHGLALTRGSSPSYIVGDGSERQRLEALVDELGVRCAVTFCGVLSHSAAIGLLKASDVLLFPSLREFGGGVVFEALAFGAVPVVADFGGPGDIVTDEVGYRIPLTNEIQMAADIESVLTHLASDRSHLEALRKQSLVYCRDYLTWEAKAQLVTKVLQWAVGWDRSGPRLSPKQFSR